MSAELAARQTTLAQLESELTALSQTYQDVRERNAENTSVLLSASMAAAAAADGDGDGNGPLMIVCVCVCLCVPVCVCVCVCGLCLLSPFLTFVFT